MGYDALRSKDVVLLLIFSCSKFKQLNMVYVLKCVWRSIFFYKLKITAFFIIFQNKKDSKNFQKNL